MNALLLFFRHFYQSALRKEKRDWEIISYCVMVSSLFWFLNAMGKVYHHNIKVPVRYQFNQKLYVPIASLPEFVEIKAEGRGWDLVRAIWMRNPSVLNVSVSNPLQTLNLYPGDWQGKMREMMPSVKLVNVLTDSIFCRFDPIESREIKLIADLKDFTVKNGYRISSPVKITPSSIRFTGAASLIRSLPPQLPLSISGKDVQDSFDQNISLDFQDEYPKNELLQYGPEMVNVHFSIRSALEDEIEIPIEIDHAEKQPGLYLKENRQRVHYLVSIPDRQKVRAGDFRLAADMATFNPADSTVELVVSKHPPIISDPQPESKKIRVYGR
jgi:hypothetical protein